ncbi:exo-alpha-sialidase [bacterium]|nr:exo-alpha-sialidase [bacterium]
MKKRLRKTGMVLWGLLAVIMLGLFIPATVLAAPQEANGISKMDLFKDVRIPRIIVARDGAILAFAEGCKIMRRSEDQGKTWSKPKTVNPDGKGNIVLDETTGDLLIVCPPLLQLLRSQDHGKTWKKERIEIKPNAIGHGTPDGVPADVVCSESGITLKFGEHKGRLVMPARIQPPKGSNAQEYWQYNYNTSMYSDDGGETWQMGEPVQSGTGEGTLAELSDGRVYYNSRCHMATDHRRRIAWSYDGGRRWTDWRVSRDLLEVGGPHYFKYGRKPSYGCNAGLVRLPRETTGGKDVLIYSTPDNPGGTSPHNGRIRMTVWASTDQAESWPLKRLVHEGISAYSSLAADKKGNIYLLFESGEEKLYQKITCAKLHVNWIMNK